MTKSPPESNSWEELAPWEKAREWRNAYPELADVIIEMGRQRAKQVLQHDQEMAEHERRLEAEAAQKRNSEKPTRRIWVQQVAVDAERLTTRLNVACARGLDLPRMAVAEGVRGHLIKARAAAFRHDPLPGRWANWWRGTLVETAYRHMHAAQVQMVDLYDEDELRAEIPVAVARAHAALHREDPRLWTVAELQGTPSRRLRPQLRELNAASFAALDANHGQLRHFRNVLLMAAVLVSVLITVTLVLVSLFPNVMPLCFPREVVTSSGPPVLTAQVNFNCPTGTNTLRPQHGDVLVVGLLGLLGGALASSFSIRHLKGSTAPYDVPTALAMLKVPLGAFTAILALVAIRGDFVPGLSNLDSQEQILAYALVFGYAQQLLTRLLDQQAQTLLGALPSKDAAKQTPDQPPVSQPHHSQQLLDGVPSGRVRRRRRRRRPEGSRVP